jgi:hypothetical protein
MKTRGPFPFPLLSTGVVTLVVMAFCHDVSLAQDFSYYDNFDDGDVSRNTDGFVLYECSSGGPVAATAASGDFVVDAQSSQISIWCPRSFSGEAIASRDEWSMRMLATVDEPDWVFIGTYPNWHHAGIMNGADCGGPEVDVMSAGINSHACDARSIKQEMPYSYHGRTLYYQIDVFDGIVTGSIWRPSDPSSLVQLSHDPGVYPSGIPGFGLARGSATFHELWISSQPIPLPVTGDFDGNGILDTTDIDSLVAAIRVQDLQFDLNADGVLDLADHAAWIKDLKQTWYGDANLDGKFSSLDLVAVLQIGKFETFQHAGWSEGDWNGDGDFDTGDLVSAFQDGGYEQGPRVAAAAAVPEPSSFFMALSLVALAVARRRRLASVIRISSPFVVAHT